jgi:hypothetical protein
MDFDQRFTPFERRHPEVGIFENVGVAILLKNYRLHLLRDQFHLHAIAAGNPTGSQARFAAAMTISRAAG